MLYWFDDFNATYSTTNTITKRMLSIGRKFDISLKVLKNWAKIVQEDLLDRNMSNTRSLGDVKQSVDDINNKLIRVLEELKETKNMNTALKEEVHDMKKMISEMHSVIVGNH